MPRSAPAPALIVAVVLALGACAPSSTAAAVGEALPAEHAVVGDASWYGPGFAGRATASGEIFDPSEMTAAHRTLPFGTRVRVVNRDNGRSVEVRINDRGPFKPGRVIDLSRAAAERIGLVGSGTASVHIEILTGPNLAWSAAADAALRGLSVRSARHLPGQLLLLSSGLEPAPVLVRVVAGGVPSDAGADLLLPPDLLERLGPAVQVQGDLP